MWSRVVPFHAGRELGEVCACEVKTSGVQSDGGSDNAGFGTPKGARAEKKQLGK